MPAPAPRKQRGLFRRAFANQYNYILLGATGLFGLAAFSWTPLVIGAGLEALWLTFGPDTPFFRRWAAKQESQEERQRAEEEATAVLAILDPRYQVRFQGIARQAERIRELAAGNTSFEAGLVDKEMEKLGKALHSFLKMAVLHQRMRTYLENTNEDEILRDIARLEKDLSREKNNEVKASIRDSLGLAEKRAKQHARLMASFKVLSLKMETLEKSLKYLESHIIGMGKHEELTSEIDDIVVGVELVVDELGLDTDGLLSNASRARAAEASSLKVVK
ncbi:MAG: hypothetical protein HY698_06680 [Deltaproteobacteria bacterium]|nr:hypothetical protein [Deltaproteobacteria bacterium]